MPKPLKNNTHRVCVAPMMDWTDRHDRFFLRLITKHAMLYTEMVTADAVIHGNRTRLLGFNAEENPIALQLGGSDPEKLAEAARIGESFGYDEVNLNVGCPSDRVQSGCFGASLMAEPSLVARCVEAMTAAVSIPVTVKSRIGIDDQDPHKVLPDFIATVHGAGCETFIIHARKAWLQGLSPKENRDVPPLDYPLVYGMKVQFPDLRIVLNGGVSDLTEVEDHLVHVDGVMLGRAAYQNPYCLADVDVEFFGGKSKALSRHQIIEALYPYMEHHLASGGTLHHITRHVLGLFQGQPGARAWRRHLAENAFRKGAGVSVVEQALALVLQSHSLVPAE